MNERTRPGLASWSFLLLALATSSLAAPPVLAAPAGKIEGLQMPAWIERHGSPRPAWPGMRLHSGDRVRTGNGARVLLRLDEGSHVRLGENAELSVDEFMPPEESGGRFRGFLKVLEGAFRYTTTALSRVHRRDLDIQVATATAGIRGTDVWGKAASDRDIVCLIEGEITVSRGDDAPLTMSEPLTFYVAPRGEPAQPVAPVSEEQLARWAAEVELTSRMGGVRRPLGGWRVILASYPRREQALAQLQRLEAAGYGADLESADVDGRTWHRLQVVDFSGPEEARAFAGSITGQLGVRDPWIAPMPEN